MHNRIVIVRDRESEYPERGTFRPSEKYPEYLFSGDLSIEKNRVYDMVRGALKLYGLDSRHFDTPEWNPLGEYVKPGDTVFLKPNMVAEKNYNEDGGDYCVYTDPSVVAPIIDYVCIALCGKGQIIVGDAPLQECVFPEMIHNSGYSALIEYYVKKGINIRLLDMRNIKTHVMSNGVHITQEPSKKGTDGGILIDIGKASAFEEFSDGRIERLRVTNFDPRVLQSHHKRGVHEYAIAKEILEADVIINMPKPKTHRKAGVTASLKNMIGACNSKEYLPHHSLGGSDEDGDAYRLSNEKLTEANRILDEKNILIASGNLKEAGICIKKHYEYLEEGLLQSGEHYWEGCWYGNDTIWRTVSDVNRIIYFSDKQGKLQKTIQRRILIVADMIVSGQGEGPLMPDPIPTGMIIVGEDPLCFDRTIASLMGFDYNGIPLFSSDYLIKGSFAISTGKEAVISSNVKDWDCRDYASVRKTSYKFIPSTGWEIRLGNPKKDTILQAISQKQRLIIFGAGLIGMKMAEYIQVRFPELTIYAFYDNNPDKWGKELLPGIYCKKPEPHIEEDVWIVAVRKVFEEDIRESINELGTESGIFYYIEG